MTKQIKLGRDGLVLYLQSPEKDGTLLKKTRQQQAAREWRQHVRRCVMGVAWNEARLRSNDASVIHVDSDML